MSEPTKIKHNDDESPYCAYPDACVNQLTREFEAYVEHNLGGTLKFRTFAERRDIEGLAKWVTSLGLRDRYGHAYTITIVQES